MSEFYKTMMGKKFFEGDVPRLVGALEKIATALDGPEPTRSICEIEECEERVSTMCARHTVENTDGAMVVDVVYILMRSGAIVGVKATEVGARAVLRDWIESLRDINRAGYARTCLEKWDGKKSAQIGEYWTVEVAAVSL